VSEKINSIYLTPQAPGPKSTSAILREVMFWSQHFKKIMILPNFGNALKMIFAMESKVDLILISSRFKADEISEFIFKARQLQRTQDSTILVIMNEGDFEKIEAVGQMLQTGVDGIVFKPYCVEIVDQICTQVGTVGSKRAIARKAVGEIFNDRSLLLLDPVADKELEGRNFESKVAYFQARGALTLKVSEKNISQYVSIAGDAVPETEPSRMACSVKGAIDFDRIDAYKNLGRPETLDKSSIAICRQKIIEGGGKGEVFDKAVLKIRHRLWLLGIQVRFVSIFGEGQK
jgi:hypothetical protein